MVLNADSSFVDLSPFFEPGAPPPTLPILLAQTEVGKIQSPSKLLAEEQIGPKSSSGSRPSGVRFSPYPKPALKQKPCSTPSRATTPSTDRRQHGRSEGRSDRSEDESDSESSDSDSSSDAESDENRLIPKPDGEAGRPGRGGYNLEETLGWEKRDFEKIKKSVKKLIEEHLDASKSFQSQSLSSINIVRKLATERFPVLSDYAQSWPAIDLIRMQLKYLSSRARLERTKADAAAGKSLRRSSRK